MKTIAAIILLSMGLHQAFSQIPNGDMEDWANTGLGYLEPVGWSTGNIPGNDPCVLKSTGHSGNFAAKMKTIDYSGSNYGGFLLLNNFPITQKPVTFSGFFKMHVVKPEDEIFAILDVYDSSGNSISNAYYETGEGIEFTNWTPFAWNFADCTGIPATMDIAIYIYTDSLETYGELDDMDVTFFDGIDEFSNTLTSLSVSPSGANGDMDLHFSVAGKSEIQFEIFDMTSRRITTLPGGRYGLGTYTVPFHLRTGSGIYLLRASGSNGQKTIRFAVSN